MKFHFLLQPSALAKPVVAGIVMLISLFILLLPLDNLETLCSLALLAFIGLKTWREQEGRVILSLTEKTIILTESQSTNSQKEPRHYQLNTLKRLGFLRILTLVNQQHKRTLWIWQDMFAKEKEWRQFNAWLNSQL